MNGTPGMTREKAEELTKEVTIKSAQLAIEVRDQVAKEQNSTPALVAGSIGNYTCCIPEGSPYHIKHNDTTDEEEYYSFH